MYIIFFRLVLADIVVRRLQSTRRLREQETSCERCSCNLRGAMGAAESYCGECKWFSISWRTEIEIDTTWFIFLSVRYFEILLQTIYTITLCTIQV